jgi:hypothetical protein
MDELSNLLMDIEDISSQHAVSRGGTAAGVTAATAINFMQERDDALMTTTYQSIEDGWEKIAKQTLSHVVQFWDVARTVSVTGVDGSFDAIALKGSELKSGTDIRMEAGSALPVSKAARQALLMDMMKFGWVDPVKGLELMEMGGLEKLYNDIKIDEQQAQRENLRIRRLDIQEIEQHAMQVQQTNSQIQEVQEEIESGAQPEFQAQPTPLTTGVVPEEIAIPGAETDPSTGVPLQMPPNIIPVNSWDNHAVHMEVHNRFRKSQAFELLSDEIKQQFEYHVQMHQQALMATMPSPEMMDEEGNPTEAPVGSNQFGPPGSEDGVVPEGLNEGMMTSG